MAIEYGPILDVSVEAAEDLSSYQYQFVILDTDGKAALMDSAIETPYGVLQNAPASGEGATVRILGVSKIVANGSLDEGVFVKPEYVSGTDCGKAQAAGSDLDLICGIVVDSASAEDDLVSVLLLPYHGQAGPRVKETTVTTDATAGNLTLTAAQLLGGLILRDPAGGARTDQLPTGALMAAAIPNVKAGMSFEFTIRNEADAAETITIGDSGTGVTLDDGNTNTIAQNNSKIFKAVFTSTTEYTVYSIGTLVH